MKVMYKNQIWDASLELRESLFETLKECDPFRLVRIYRLKRYAWWTYQGTHILIKEEKDVPIKELTLYSIWRNATDYF